MQKINAFVKTTQTRHNAISDLNSKFHAVSLPPDPAFPAPCSVRTFLWEMHVGLLTRGLCHSILMGAGAILYKQFDYT